MVDRPTYRPRPPIVHMIQEVSVCCLFILIAEDVNERFGQVEDKVQDLQGDCAVLKRSLNLVVIVKRR